MTTLTNLTENETMLQLNNTLRSYLTGELSVIADEDLNLLTRLFSGPLAFRDAFITYVVAPSEVSVEDMCLFATKPHSPEAGTLMSAILNGRFTDGSEPDALMFDRARELMESVACTEDADDRCVAQTRAVTAYLYWWQGNNGEAIPAAVDALTLYEDCTLAVIVLTAIKRGINRKSS